MAVSRFYMRNYIRDGLVLLVTTIGWIAVNVCETQVAAASPPMQAMQWLADAYVDHQLPNGAWDAAWAPPPNTEGFMLSLTSIEMYKAFEVTGNQNYKTYADRAFDYYYQRRSTAISTSATAAILLDNWATFKRHNPQSTQYDAAMAPMYDYMMTFRWAEPSYFRCGYPGQDGLDVAFACDLSLIGSGLLSYHAMTGNTEALEAARGMAPYFVAEMSPSTNQGAWSTAYGTWAVGTTPVIGWEHHPVTPANSVGWGTGCQTTALFLARLYPMITDTNLKNEVKEKSVTSMKWQFDACQFPNGAVGMCGLDDHWVGMADAAIQTFLWNCDAGFLTKEEIAEYAPKAQAAADWILSLMSTEQETIDVANCGGYYEDTGVSENSSLYDVAMSRYYLAWSFDALIRYDDISSVPEPATITLLTLGIGGLILKRRR